MNDEGPNSVTLSFNLFQLKQQLENAKGHEISWAEISRQTGVQPNTLTGILKNRTRRVDLATLERLLTFFHNEGLAVEPGDLFVMKRMAASGPNK
jgi:transcriptional regulator with XRE-family HTH domain